jgi:hypothetical protein
VLKLPILAFNPSGAAPEAAKAAPLPKVAEVASDVLRFEEPEKTFEVLPEVVLPEVVEEVASEGQAIELPEAEIEAVLSTLMAQDQSA